MAKGIRPASAMLVVLASVSDASATASLTCDADDSFLSVRVQAVIGHAGSFNAVDAKAVIKSQGRSVKPIELADEHVVQRWATGRDIRLRFFRYEPAYAVDLTIETRGKKDDEEERPGRYRLEFTGLRPDCKLRRSIAKAGQAARLGDVCRRSSAPEHRRSAAGDLQTRLAGPTCGSKRRRSISD